MKAVALHEDYYISTYFNFNYFGESWQLQFGYANDELKNNNKNLKRVYKSVPNKITLMTDLNKIYITTLIKAQTNSNEKPNSMKESMKQAI